jgi:purine-binding chemotaxis protein CheW
MTTELLVSPQESALHPPGKLHDDLVEEESDIRQFVTFIAGDEVFAVDMQPVQEIIRVPDVVRVPLAPRTLDGLANLRGKVLPIISLRRIFGFTESDYNDSTRAIVIGHDQQALGFVVDRVASVVGVDQSQIEDTSALSTTVDTELISGLLKNVGEYPMVMVLDFAKLIAREFSDLAAVARINTGKAMEAVRTADADEEFESDELKMVSFEVAQQEYAIIIDDVQEIVQVPELIVHMPHSDSHVLGVMTLRNRLLPLVSLRQMFGLPIREVDEQSRIVVVSLGATSVGVLVDNVNEVLRVGRGDADAMPSFMARDGKLSHITQICRLNGGRRLVSILSVTNMFQHSTIKDAMTTVDAMNGKQLSDATQDKDDVINDDEEQIVIFRIGKEEFGVPIASVQEIVRVPEALTQVPKAPPSVKGMINLRGTVLAVPDLRRRLGLEAVERGDRQRIMVFLVDGIRTGFIVDSVAEVLKVHKSCIEPAPLLSGDRSNLLARMANLERQKRLIQIIDPIHLIEKDALSDLAQMTVAQA